MYTETKKVPIIASGKFNVGNGTTGSLKLREVGYYLVELTYDRPDYNEFISSKKIKTVFY